MSAFTFNVALGREVEYYNRVDANDPSTARLLMVVLALSGLETDAVLKDKDTLADVLSGTTNEVTNSGYARKALTDSDIAAFTIDDALDKVTLVLPIQTFSSIVAGDAWRKVLICYDPNSSADSAIIPIHAGDLLIDGVAVVPNGSNILVDYTAGFVTCQ